MSLSREEMARAKFTFSIYDFEGTNKIDAFQLGNALRALGLCPTLKRISDLGGAIQRNEKMLSVEEFLAIYQDAKKDKEEGTFEDYMEALFSHDKDKSGKLEAKTLVHLLQGYGKEPLDRLEAEEIINDCGEPDDEGMVDYKKFIKNLMKGPEIKIPIAMLRATEDAEDSGFQLSRRDSVDVPTQVRKRSSLKNKDDPTAPATGKVSRKSSKVAITVDPDVDNFETEQSNDSKRKLNEAKDVDSAEIEEAAKSIEDEGTIGNSRVKRSSIRRSGKSGENTTGSYPDEGKLSVPSSARNSRKGSKGQVEGEISENDTRGRSISPENDVSALSETYQEDFSSRNSIKSGKDQGGNEDKDESRADADDISSLDDGGLSRKASRKSGGSGRSKKSSGTDLSLASEEPSENLGSARSTLKSEKSRKSTDSKKKLKAGEPPEVKAKFQQPLVSLKTAAMFGNQK